MDWGFEDSIFKIPHRYVSFPSESNSGVNIKLSSVMAAALTLDIRPSIKCLTDLCIAYTKHLSRGVSRCLLCAQTATPPPVVDATGAAAISAASGALAAYAATVRSEKAARALRDGDGVVSFPLPPPSPAAACPHLAPFSGLGPPPSSLQTTGFHSQCRMRRVP